MKNEGLKPSVKDFYLAIRKEVCDYLKEKKNGTHYYFPYIEFKGHHSLWMAIFSSKKIVLCIVHFQLQSDTQQIQNRTLLQLFSFLTIPTTENYHSIYLWICKIKCCK